MNHVIMRDLRSAAQETENALRIPIYDFSDADAVKRLEKVIDDEFAARIRAYRAIDKRSGVLSRNDWDDALMDRRKQAVAKLAAEADARYREMFPEMCAAEAFVRICAPCNSLTFDGLNSEYDVELAAAIWMLDHLASHEAYEEAAAGFPRSEDELKTVDLPNLVDAAHSDDALKAMKYLIRNRNRGMRGFDAGKAFMDEADADSQKADTEDRRRFDAVMALIDEDTKDALKKRFLGCMEQLTDGIMALIAVYENKRRRCDSALLGAVRQQLKKDDQPQMTVSTSEPFLEKLPEIRESEESTERLFKEADDARRDLERACRFVLLYPTPGREWIEDFSDSEPFDRFEGLDIRDPYEMCFAFLCLLDENSDMIWAYNIAYDVLSYACQALPWAGFHAAQTDDEEEEDELQIDFDLLATLAEKTPDWDKNNTGGWLYEKRIRSPLLAPENEKINIAQLAFLASGLVVPRQNDLLAFTKILLSDAQLSKSEADIWYAYIMLAYAVAHKESDYAEIADDQSEDAETDSDAEQEIKSLKKEIKNLRRRVNLLEHRNREQSEERQKAERKLKAAAEELTELRTMIRESVNTEKDSPVTVAFPYTPQKRAIIVGGHESWVKAIKPLLNNTRFITPSEKPNPGVIMNAEVVWIQTNALGHSGYYKIIDIIRKNNIKVCYFKYASAEKCAEQFALEDMGENGDTEDAPPTNDGIQNE